jgi:hypothetical protein
MTAKRIAETLFLILVPLALFLALGELALRAYLSSHIFFDVEMSRYALALKLDSENPLIGHHHRPSAEARLMGVTVRTNATASATTSIRWRGTGVAGSSSWATR